MMTINEILQSGNAVEQIQKMTDSELKLLNTFICSEMNYRKGNRIAAAKAILSVGDRVDVNHKRLMYAKSLYIVKIDYPLYSNFHIGFKMFSSMFDPID